MYNVQAVLHKRNVYQRSRSWLFSIPDPAVWRIRDVYPRPDPGSRFLPIPDPGSRISDSGSRIPDQKTSTKERGEKNFLSYLFMQPQISKNLSYFSFEVLKKKIWANFQWIIELFTKYGLGIRDPRSGIRKKPIPDPGSRSQKGTGSRIRIRNTVCNTVFPRCRLFFLHIYFFSSETRAEQAPPHLQRRIDESHQWCKGW